MAEGLQIVRHFMMQLGYSEEMLDLVHRLPGLMLPYMSLLLLIVLLWLVLLQLVKVALDLHATLRGKTGLVSAYALLAQGYHPIVFDGTSDSSTLAVGALAPKAIYRWTVTADQLREELQHLHHVYVRALSFDPQYDHQVEESCRDVFMMQGPGFVNRVLKAERQPVSYHKPGTKIKSGGEPDFSADVMVAGKRTGIVVVGEAKTPRMLEDVADDLISTRHVGSLRETICQVWGYLMDADGEPEAGFFGTTNRTWFFRADRANQAMYITDAVHCHAESPSVRQMLYLMLRLTQLRKHRPLPMDAVQWAQRDFNRILVDEIRGNNHQGQQGRRGQQHGGTGKKVGHQAPVTRSQVKARELSNQHMHAARALTGHIVVPFEEFRDRVPIGGGETGTVFAAWLHDRRVAVKSSDCYNRKNVVRRLFNEVATYKALQHLQGNVIPRLEEYGYTMYGGAYFVATQLIAGRTHEEGREVPLAQRRSAERALRAIHALGYLHGDVRGDNLIFEEGTGKVFFLDLGFSRACNCDADFQAEMYELRELLLPNSTIAYNRPHT